MARLAHLQRLGTKHSMRESDDAERPTVESGNRRSVGSGRSNHGGRNRPTAEKAGGLIGNGSDTTVDIRAVERMREAVIRADEARSWRDYIVVIGAFLLGICVVATLVIASATNARANRIIAADIERDRLVAQRNTRVDEYLRRIDTDLAEHFRLLQDHTNSTVTTVPATTPTTRKTTPTTRRPSPPATTRPSPPTTAVRPPTTAVRPSTPTTKACSFAILDTCLIP